MQNTDDSEYRNCQNCNNKVYDLRAKSNSQINNWFKKNKENACVIANANQLTFNSRNKYSFFNLRKIGIASVFISSSFLNPNLYAQESKKANSFVIEQTDLNSKKITIEGIVKVKGLIGWKRLAEYNINVYSNNTLVTESLLDEKGKFKLELDKNILSDKMTISIHAVNYKSIRIEEIEVKDTMIKIYLEKRGPRVLVGRFY